MARARPREETLQWDEDVEESRCVESTACVGYTCTCTLDG